MIKMKATNKPTYLPEILPIKPESSLIFTLFMIILCPVIARGLTLIFNNYTSLKSLAWYLVTML